MALKKPNVLSRADFDQAVVRLRLNVSDVAKETEIPRTYLSEFRNGDRTLRPEHLAKLRDYFESKGIEFEDDPAPAEDRAPSPTGPAPGVSVAAVRFLTIDRAVSDTTIAAAMDALTDADARLAVLLQKQVARDGGMFGSGEFTEETAATLQEAFALLAQGYVIVRMMRGWPAFGLAPSGDDPATVRDLIAQTFSDKLAAVGLFKTATDDTAAADTDAADSQRAAA